jgi:hypothetical protein
MFPFLSNLSKIWDLIRACFLATGLPMHRENPLQIEYSQDQVLYIKLQGIKLQMSNRDIKIGRCGENKKAGNRLNRLPAH